MAPFSSVHQPRPTLGELQLTESINEQQAYRREKIKTATRVSQRKQNQARLLAAVESGSTIAQACRDLKINRGTYDQWRKRYSDFRAKVDTIRLGSLVAADLPFQGDFISFRLKYMGLETYFHQREIIHAIETAKASEVVLVLVAPETGKTTVLEDYVCFKLGGNPDFRITFVSEGQNHVRKINRRIQRRMTDHGAHSDFIERFGPFYIPGQEKQGKPWSADYFTVYKAGHDERDYSFEGRGWRSAVAGTRTDLLLVDDIQSRRSVNLTANMLETFRQDFLSRPGREGRIVVVGTRVEQGDFYEAIQEAGIVTRTVILPIMDRDGKSLCPEMWPEDALETKRRLVGEAAWWRNYMQKPQSTMDATFDDEAMKNALRPNLVLGNRLSERAGAVCTLDPALQGGNALVVCDYNPKEMQVVDSRYDFNISRTEAIMARIQDLAERYRFDDLIIEANAFQSGFGLDNRLIDMSHQFGFRISPHQTGRNKNDPDLGVARMPTTMRATELAIPWGNDEAKLVMGPLEAQLRSWRPDIPAKRRRQDLVMALWFAWLFWQERRGSLSGTTGTISTRNKLPYVPTMVRPLRRGVGVG